MTKRAEALAQYGMAVREGISGNEEESINRLQAASTADPANLELKVELALAFLQAGRYDEMEQQVDAILAADPSMVRALRLKSFGDRLRGRLRESLDPLEQAMRLDPTEASHFIEAASIRNRLGEGDAAAATIEKGLATVTNRLEAFHALAQLYLDQTAKDIAAGKALAETPLEIIATATAEFPDDALLLAFYGDLLALHERLTEAIEIFARVEAMDPDDNTIRQKLALSLVSIGDRQRAINLLEEVVARQPGNYRLWLYLAELHQAEGDIDKAAEHYRAGIELRPALPENYLKLAHLLMVNQRGAEARHVLEEGQQACPGDHRIIELLAYTWFRERAFSEAADAFRQAESNMNARAGRPFLAGFHAMAAIASQMSGDPAEAARLLRAGAADQPHVLNDYIGSALRSRKGSLRLTSSLEVLTLITDVIPKDLPTHTLLGLLHMRAEEYEVALFHFQEAERLAVLEENDEALNAQFYFWLGSCSERIKEFDQAESYFTKAIDAQPDFADAHNYLAYMNAERGVKLEEALDHVGVALAVEPENSAYLDTRGWIYYRMGRYQEALEDITLAVEKLPDDPTITDHLGDTHLALGNAEEAVVWWKKSYALDQTNDAVKQKLIDRGVDLATITPVNPDGEPSDADTEEPGIAEEEE